MEDSKQTGRIYKCVRCKLHGKNVVMKNHTRICPYLYCNCTKCVNFLDYRSTINSKRLIDRQLKNSRQSESSFQNENLFEALNLQSLPHFSTQQVPSEKKKNSPLIDLLTKPKQRVNLPSQPNPIGEMTQNLLAQNLPTQNLLAQNLPNPSQIQQQLLNLADLPNLTEQMVQNLMTQNLLAQNLATPTDQMAQQNQLLLSKLNNDSLLIPCINQPTSQPSNTFQLLSNYSNLPINIDQNEIDDFDTQSYLFDAQSPSSTEFLSASPSVEFSNEQLKQMLLTQSLMVIELLSKE